MNPLSSPDYLRQYKQTLVWMAYEQYKAAYLTRPRPLTVEEHIMLKLKAKLACLKQIVEHNRYD